MPGMERSGIEMSICQGGQHIDDLIRVKEAQAGLARQKLMKMLEFVRDMREAL
jgi:hypothetical protein